MVASTIASLFVTICCAYPLSVPGFKGAKLLMPMCIITMYFSGGLIPPCAVTGEAAGLALAISSDLSKLSVEDLQSRLRENGVKLHIDEVL
jgi:ABC-type glycerol-3-phosphate transport system permease component